MKVELCQLNYHIGNFKSNSDKIISHISNAKKSGIDLIVFSELSVCGYPPLDMLEQKDFIEGVKKNIDLIALHCIGIAAIIGGPSVNSNERGKNLYNSAFFLSEGKITFIQNKTLLPTYDIFDEYRYFEPNTSFSTIKFKGKKIALTICEDLWDNQPVENSFAKSKIYVESPMEQLIKENPDLIVNIAASPFSYNQSHNRATVLQENAIKYKLPIIYVNQVGANTELIFDGGSLVINSKGEIIRQLKYFEEDSIAINTDEIDSLSVIKIKESDYIQKIHDALILGIKDYFQKTGFSKAVLGLSGGIDSALVLTLAVEALGNENVRVLLMPSKYSSDHSINDAVKLAENLNVKFEILPIQLSVDSVISTLKNTFSGQKEDVTEENIQARIRGILLMGISNKFGNILLNTTNKSEAAVGYGTLYGDMNGGLSILGDVYKSDVFKLANYLNKDFEIIPYNTISKPPSAELKPDQKDTDSLPEYDVLDKILYNFIEQKKSIKEISDLGFDYNLVAKIASMVNRNEYKRFQAPPILRISSKAFGIGRRYPIVAKY
ncbi:MAG: NAD+ synthase [Bacteroidetes bacterium GWA2_31_9]|nr:MAG: NAD+ synthase [Bacteroidetes bacterium GWA2_31_9]